MSLKFARHHQRPATLRPCSTVPFRSSVVLHVYSLAIVSHFDRSLLLLFAQLMKERDRLACHLIARALADVEDKVGIHISFLDHICKRFF